MSWRCWRRNYVSDGTRRLTLAHSRKAVRLLTWQSSTFGGSTATVMLDILHYGVGSADLRGHPGYRIRRVVADLFSTRIRDLMPWHICATANRT